MKKKNSLDQVQAYRLAEFRRPSFAAAEIIHATGLPEKTLQNYLARYEDAMQLSAPAPGKGQRRMYSAADAVYLAAVRAIANFGVAPSAAILLANHVRAWVMTEARWRYECGFTGLPAQYFGFGPKTDGNGVDLMVQGAGPEIQSWAAEHGH
ncbi:MAG TPA: hypothetical protein VFQ79_11435, partial [Bryobacteraceae bacterium]|nr:hypothetical protein [Bryobacteraceae bacterium]